MTDIDKFRLTISMAATVTITDAAGQPQDWLRPATEAATTWRGMPTQDELLMAYNDMNAIAAATLEDVLTNSIGRLEEARRAG